MAAERFTLWIIPLLLCVWYCKAQMPTREVQRILFKDYEKMLRPNCGPGQDIVNVHLDAGIRQILSLNEPTQVLTTKMWMRMKWIDCRLTWDQNETGVSHIVVSPDIVWTPDITLYEQTEGDMFTEMGDYRVLIKSDGHISYLWPAILYSFCKLRVTYFPYDVQTCGFTFGSWRYDGSEVNFWNMSEKGDTSQFQDSAEWRLTSYEIQRDVTYYDGFPAPFVTLTFKVGTQRRSLMYVICLILPCILVAALSMLGFLLPIDSGEKVSLQLTVLLSLSVFLLVIQETLPPSADTVPILGLYFAVTMGQVAFSTLMTICAIYLHFKTKTRAPEWAKKYLLGTLARVLCMGSLEDDSAKVPSAISRQCKRTSFHNMKAWVNRFRRREDGLRGNVPVRFNDITSNLKQMNETKSTPKKNASFTNGGLSLSDESLSVTNGGLIISKGGISTENHGDGDTLQRITVVGDEETPILKYGEIRNKGTVSIFSKDTASENAIQSSPKEVLFGSRKSCQPPVKSIDIKCKCSGGQEESLKTIASHYTDEGFEEERADEWHKLAMVVDRFCFFISFFFITGATMAVFIEFTSL